MDARRPGRNLKVESTPGRRASRRWQLQCVDTREAMSRDVGLTPHWSVAGCMFRTVHARRSLRADVVGGTTSPSITDIPRHFRDGNVSGCRSHTSLECRGMYVSYRSRLTLAACGRCGRDYVTVDNRHTETLQGSEKTHIT